MENKKLTESIALLKDVLRYEIESLEKEIQAGKTAAKLLETKKKQFDLLENTFSEKASVGEAYDSKKLNTIPELKLDGKAEFKLKFFIEGNDGSSCIFDGVLAYPKLLVDKEGRRIVFEIVYESASDLKDFKLWELR